VWLLGTGGCSKAKFFADIIRESICDKVSVEIEVSEQANMYYRQQSHVRYVTLDPYTSVVKGAALVSAVENKWIDSFVTEGREGHVHDCVPYALGV
jgi:hypothetical protein